VAPAAKPDNVSTSAGLEPSKLTQILLNSGVGYGDSVGTWIQLPIVQTEFTAVIVVNHPCGCWGQNLLIIVGHK